MPYPNSTLDRSVRDNITSIWEVWSELYSTCTSAVSTPTSTASSVVLNFSEVETVINSFDFDELQRIREEFMSPFKKRKLIKPFGIVSFCKEHYKDYKGV